MEGTMDMISNASNSSAAASAPHNHQQEDAMVVSSSTKKAKAAQQAGGSGEPKPRPLQDAAHSCPRCSSKNTKFCYYNNCNLNQPRHFCKNCRRYWTQGGTLRLVPVGGSCRRNKRASGSSSSSDASSTAATSAEMDKTVRLMLTAASTMSMPPSLTTGLIRNDMLPTFTPTAGSGLDLAMDDQDQQGFLPFAPLSLSDDQAPEKLAPGGGDTTPTLLDMLTGGFLEGVGSSSNYGGGLEFDMGGGSNGMDMSFLLPEMGTSAPDPMQVQLLEGMEMDDVEGELLWASYINDDGGYAASPAAGAEQQQQVAGDQQQEEDNNKAKESSKNNNDDGGSSEYSYWINNTNNTDGVEG